MEKANQVREHAAYIRNNPNNAQAVADALDVIADAMDGKCEDCGQPVEQLQGIGIDAPDVGADPMGENTNVGA